MAIVWQKKHQGTQYQVRRAGQTLRLYTDNVLHSQFNPKKKLTGSVWDLLFLPALSLPKDKPLRILVLGVGGGAVIHMLNEFLNCEKIIGLELNPIHIQVAEKHFAVKGDNIELIQDDAIKWVKNFKAKKGADKFDLIIDDLFYEEDGEPVKVAPPNSAWFYQLFSLLKPKGSIIMNFVGRHTAMKAAPLYDDYAAKLFPHGLHFTTPYYDNHVLAFSSQALTSKLIRQAIDQHEDLKQLKKHLRFSCRTL
jgi:spermidine synthase